MLSVRQILESFWDGTVPVNVVAIARQLGVQAQPNASVAVVETWLSGTSRRIEFNPTEIPKRQRFAVAHALGHLMLGHLKDGERHNDTAKNFGAKQTGKEEEANRFAMRLLVPDGALRHSVLQRGIVQVETLAETFEVSQVLMAARLQQVALT